MSIPKNEHVGNPPDPGGDDFPPNVWDPSQGLGSSVHPYTVDTDCTLDYPPCKAPTNVNTPPATERDLVQWLNVLMQLTWWLHAALKGIETETEKLCRSLAAMRALEVLTSEIDDSAAAAPRSSPDPNEALKGALHDAARDLYGAASTKCGSAPNILNVDAQMKAVATATVKVCWDVFIFPFKSFSELLPDSGPPFCKALRQAFPSIMDRSPWEIVRAYAKDMSQQLEAREAGLEICDDVTASFVEELSKTPKFQQLADACEGAINNPAENKSLVHVLLEQAGEAGIKSLGPEGLTLSMLKVVGLAKLPKVAQDVASAKIPSDWLLERVLPALHLVPEDRAEALKRSKAIEDGRRELAATMKNVKANAAAGALRRESDDLLAQLAAHDLHTECEKLRELIVEKCSAQDGAVANSALTVFAVIQIIGIWNDLGEPAASATETAQNLLALTTAGLEGAAALGKMATVLGTKIAPRFTRDVLANFTAVFAEDVARAVPLLNIITGGLQAIDGIAKGDPEKALLGGVNMLGGVSLWLGTVYGTAEELGSVGLGAAFTGIGDILIIGSGAYLVITAIRDLRNAATGAVLKQLMEGLQRKDSWAGQSYVSVLGLDAQLAKVKASIDKLDDDIWEPVIARDELACLPDTSPSAAPGQCAPGTTVVTFTKVQEKEKYLERLKHAGFGEEIASELVMTTDEWLKIRAPQTSPEIDPM